jgi:branched-chain amino acid transport system ATP-binding protein
MLDEPLLRVQGLASRYGRIPALDGISLHVAAGELVAIVGANGAGKTTLLRTLSGVQPLAAGTIRFDGADIGRETPRRRVQRGMVQVPEGRQVFGALSVEDNLLLGAFARGAAGTVERVWAMFPALADKRAEAAGTLSGGQQQRTSVARALYNGRPILIGDEPVSALDRVQGSAVLELIKARHETLVLAMHDIYLALEHADRIVVLEQGRKVVDAQSSELTANELLRQIGGVP